MKVGILMFDEFNLINKYCIEIGLIQEKKLMLLEVTTVCKVCNYCYFYCQFKFQNSICNGFHDLTIVCLNNTDINIIIVKGVDKYYKY